MRHIIMGFPKDEDYASFKHEILASASDLEPIMGWVDEGDCFDDYRLTAEQITALERLCSLVLPKELELFITCHS